MARGMLAFSGFFALAVAGCDLPRDAAGTTELIRERGEIHVGIIEGAPLNPDAERMLDAAAAKLGATIRRERGHGEDLLRRLEDGDLDLVYGHFALDSPWSANVHLGRVPGAVRQPGREAEAPRFAFRNGENGWIMTMETIGP